MPYPAFVARADPVHRGLWEGIHRLARVPAWALAVPPGERRHFLALAEDWCGDAVNTLPVVASWVEQVPGLELRVLRRDEHPDVMERYLTNGARAIPIVIALDAGFRELGHWGPRPGALQAWVVANRASLPRDERHRAVRRWYAADRGHSTLLEVMQSAGLPAGAGAEGEPRPT